MTQEQVQKIREGLACCSQTEPACTECPYIDIPRCHFTLTKDVIDYLEEDES